MKRTILLLSIFLIAGCDAITSMPVQATSTPIIIVSTETKSMFPTLLPEPTPTISTPIPSPVASLLSADAEAMIFDLLQSNGDCLLPCWWGLTPGITSQMDAQSLLENLVTDTSNVDYYDNVSGASWLIEDGELILDLIVSFTHDRTLVNDIENFRITMEVKRELSEGGFETVWENPLNERYLHAYMLPQVLSIYGQPKDILVFANKGWMYFSLILDYSDRGFAVWYSAPLESSDENYIGCMSKAFTRLYLWTPEFSYTWAEGISGDKSEIDSLIRDFRPLEEVTSTTLEEFHNTLINTDHIGCIETPKELWPGP